MAYESILLDVDDTLLNFKAGQRQAVDKLFRDQGLELTPVMRNLYEAKNHQLWSDLEKGLVSREFVLAERFTYIFKEYGLVKDGAAMDQIFRKYLAAETIFMEGAKAAVKELAQSHDLYVVTNGVAVTQHSRLANAGLTQYFKGIYISEEVGYQKPNRQFFDYLFEHSPEIDPNKTLIVGDSLTADIQGGVNAGINTCWYNPEGLLNSTTVTPTFEINNLNQLKEFV